MKNIARKAIIGEQGFLTKMARKNNLSICVSTITKRLGGSKTTDYEVEKNRQWGAPDEEVFIISIGDFLEESIYIKKTYAYVHRQSKHKN